MVVSARLSLALLAVTAVTALPAETDGWLELNRLDPLAAKISFADHQDRSSQLGLALALLGLHPRTEAHVAQAQALLTAVRNVNPDDDTGIAATYELARINQLFVQPADPASAVNIYRALLAKHRGNAIAERAAPKLAVLLLYADVSEDVWDQSVAEINALLPTLHSPSAQRDTRLILADAWLRMRSDHAQALPLLAYCLQNDLIVRPPAIAIALLTAAECARVTGHKAEAAAYYRRYAQEFPLETSTFEAERRANELTKEVQP